MQIGHTGRWTFKPRFAKGSGQRTSAHRIHHGCHVVWCAGHHGHVIPASGKTKTRQEHSAAYARVGQLVGSRGRTFAVGHGVAKGLTFVEGTDLRDEWLFWCLGWRCNAHQGEEEGGGAQRHGAEEHPRGEGGSCLGARLAILLLQQLVLMGAVRPEVKEEEPLVQAPEVTSGDKPGIPAAMKNKEPQNESEFIQRLKKLSGQI